MAITWICQQQTTNGPLRQQTTNCRFPPLAARAVTTDEAGNVCPLSHGEVVPCPCFGSVSDRPRPKVTLVAIGRRRQASAGLFGACRVSSLCLRVFFNVVCSRDCVVHHFLCDMRTESTKYTCISAGLDVLGIRRS